MKPSTTPFAPAHEHRSPDKLSEKSRKTLGLKEQATYALPKLPGAAGPPTSRYTGELYDGAELRPFDGRPGAMDAFAIKSLGLSP